MPSENNQSHSFEALGTKWWIEVFDEIDDKTLEDAFGILERFAREFEDNYSRFKADSLISKLNRERILEAPSEEFRALLVFGKELYLRTNTHFNFLTGHIQEARGYDSQYSFIPKNTDEVRPGNPITDLILNNERIELIHGNVDLGGCGKGYLIDEMTKLLQEQFSLRYFIINGGGDIYATSKNNEPIEIYLEHPTNPKHYIHRTTLFDQGFAASSPFKRVWKVGKQTYSHIVTDDTLPRVASFVKDKTARDADAFATAALLLTETELTALAQDENLGIARFTPATNRFWQVGGF